MDSTTTTPPSTQEEIVQGLVERITFRNQENGYVVISVKSDEFRLPITVVGTAPSVQIGTTIVARGTYKDHPKFGRQLVAYSITETLPSTKESIERYLGSGAIKGIGKETARRITKEFGEDALEVIYHDPNRLGRIKGIGISKARLLSAAFAQHRDLHKVYQFLISHGVSQSLATKIYDRYGNRSIEVLQRDPYILAYELKGIGFIKADKIAQNLGLMIDSPERLRAGLLYALDEASDKGHCFLPQDRLFAHSYKLLGLSGEISFEEHVHFLAHLEKIIVTDKGIHLPALHRSEEIINDFISQRREKRKKPFVSRDSVDQSLKKASQELGITFSEQQHLAVYDSVEQQMLIITGGPGCGKTTITKAITSVFREHRFRLLLAAPTGRAAQRMAQVCNFEARTIHRLLGFDPKSGRFRHGLADQLEVDCVIIDEASMLDVRLAASLFQAIPKEATIILVGDKDQLPSVGPGRLFGDLIENNLAKIVTLSQLFRRSDTSTINHVAHTINKGVFPDIPEPDGVTKVDAYFIPRKTAEEAADVVEKLFADQLQKKFGFTHDEILLLTPSNRGPLGTIALNQRLQARVNPPDPEKASITVDSSTEFRVGDKVCQRVNNYQLDECGVFNGDTGKVYEILPKEQGIIVDLWDGRLIAYSLSDIQQLSLAYAITVHRSQGSEIPCVVLVLHESHSVLLERQLIYTAVTRAKKLLVVVGSRRALHSAVRRTSASERFTTLNQRMREVKFD